MKDIHLSKFRNIFLWLSIKINILLTSHPSKVQRRKDPQDTKISLIQLAARQLSSLQAILPRILKERTLKTLAFQYLDTRYWCGSKWLSDRTIQTSTHLNLESWHSSRCSTPRVRRHQRVERAPTTRRPRTSWRPWPGTTSTIGELTWFWCLVFDFAVVLHLQRLSTATLLPSFFYTLPLLTSLYAIHIFPSWLCSSSYSWMKREEK